MNEDMRGQLIAQLTNLKNQNKTTVSLDIDFVLKALREPDTMPKQIIKKASKVDADAGRFKD